MITPTLDVLHANGHNEETLVAWLRATAWDVASLAEADRLTEELRRIPDTRVHVTDADYDRARDTPILVRDRYKALGWKSSKVSKALGRVGSSLRRVAPPRTLTEAYFEHPVATAGGYTGIAVLNYHPDAGPKQLNGKDRDAAIVKEYRRGWGAVRRAVRRLRREGYLVVVTSDAQMGSGSLRPWAPRAQAARMGLKWWAFHIDWVMWDPRLELEGQPRTHKLFDHYGILARFRLARRAAKR